MSRQILFCDFKNCYKYELPYMMRSWFRSMLTSIHSRWPLQLIWTELLPNNAVTGLIKQLVRINKKPGSDFWAGFFYVYHFSLDRYKNLFHYLQVSFLKIFF